MLLCVRERKQESACKWEYAWYVYKGNGNKSEFISARRRVRVVWECMTHDAILTNRLRRVILIFWIFLFIKIILNLYITLTKFQISTIKQ